MVTYCIVSSVINAVTSTLLGVFVLSRGIRNPKNITYFLFSAAIAVWSFFYYLWQVSDSYGDALLFSRLLMVGSIFIPVLYLHHLFYLLGLQKSRSFLLKASYGAAFAWLLADFTPYFVSDVSPKLGFRYWLDAGVLYHPFTLWWLATVLYTEWVIFRAFRESKGVLRKQMLYLFVGTVIGYAGGSTNFFLCYNIPIPPFGHLLVSFYVVVTAYAIIRHRLMDIEVLIKRTVIFAGLLALVFGIFALAAVFVREVLTARYGLSHRWSYLIAIFFVVLGYDPLRKVLVHLTDRFLFQKKYDYQKLLRDATAGISKIKSLRHLLSLVVHFVTMRVRVKNAAVLVYDEPNKFFRFCHPRGYPFDHRLRGGIVLNRLDPLIDYMARGHRPVEVERIKEYAEGAASGRKKGADRNKHDLNLIRKRLEELEASCCVPSFLGAELRGALVLGEKKSGDMYTAEDLDVLYTLAQESAIAIENARLYDQAVEKAEELERINEELSRAQTELIRALSETEVANKRLRDTQAQLIHEQKMATLGRLASSVGHEVNNPLTILSMNVSRAVLKHRKNPDLKVNEILDVFHKMEQNISRIKAVVNTLTGLLKKSEHGKFEPLSLKLVLEETLPLVQFQTYLENMSGTEVVFDVPSHLPLVKGDLERLQEVFLNLFINAYHAMLGKQDGKIKVTAREDPAHPGMISIEFTDNGCGMSDEVLKKVFSYGFTTKSAGKGSGMGLYMCRYIIELHGGEVKVHSQRDLGTTFTITVPAYRERQETSASSGGTAQS